MDALSLILPTIGAIGGAYLGVRWQARSQADSELRALLDDAAAVLARADQKRGDAYVRFLQEGVNTSEQGVEALRAFRRELSEADQIRHRIGVRAKAGEPAHGTFVRAVEALGEVSMALGTAVALPPNSPRDLMDLDDRMCGGEEDFNRAREQFLEAAGKRFG